MASLASSDILMATVCIPFTVLSNVVFHYWPFGSALCPIVGFVQVLIADRTCFVHRRFIKRHIHRE
jgi:neuropeptide Y receptor